MEELELPFYYGMFHKFYNAQGELKNEIFCLLHKLTVQYVEQNALDSSRLSFDRLHTFITENIPLFLIDSNTLLTEDWKGLITTLTTHMNWFLEDYEHMKDKSLEGFQDSLKSYRNIELNTPEEAMIAYCSSIANTYLKSNDIYQADTQQLLNNTCMDSFIPECDSLGQPNQVLSTLRKAKLYDIRNAIHSSSEFFPHSNGRLSTVPIAPFRLVDNNFESFRGIQPQNLEDYTIFTQSIAVIDAESKKEIVLYEAQTQQLIELHDTYFPLIKQIDSTHGHGYGTKINRKCKDFDLVAQPMYMWGYRKAYEQENWNLYRWNRNYPHIYNALLPWWEQMSQSFMGAIPGTINCTH
jgi:hypothetical protein